MTQTPTEPFLKKSGFDMIRGHVADLQRAAQSPLAAPEQLREGVLRLARVVLDLCAVAETQETQLKAMSRSIETLIATTQDLVPVHDAGGCPYCSAEQECPELQRIAGITTVVATAVMHTVRTLTTDRQAPSERARIIAPGIN